MSGEYSDIQPSDTTGVREAAENELRKRASDVLRDQELAVEAEARELIGRAEIALTGNTATEAEWASKEDDEEAYGRDDPDAVLAALGATLEECEGIDAALNPAGPVSPRHLMLWSEYRQRRRAGRAVPNLVQEWETYVAVAKGAGVIPSVTDQSRMAPVRLETLQARGAKSDVEDGEQTPVGRRRMAADSAVEPEEGAVEIPHADAKHLLVVANPRAGKDSTICRICGNLKDEHGYKWISLHDDGRNEVQMIEIPTDDPALQQNLDSFGQSAKGYRTTVYVPAVDLPDRVPSNYQPFTISVDDLTASLVARLAGIIDPGKHTENRLKKAVEEAQNDDGSVKTLIRKIREFADETTAKIQVKRPDTNEDGEWAGIEDWGQYEMPEDEALLDIADNLMLAAGSGIIRDRGAPTNIDIREVVSDQDRVASLNCSHLVEEEGGEGERLKYLIILIWLELVWSVRASDPDLPRVALEIRELKDLAPSKIGDTKFKDIARALQQRLYDIGSRGSSRRVMMLGSTQKNNDVYKSVRANMEKTIALRLDSEKIDDLTGRFTGEERSQLTTFPTGWGMLIGGRLPNSGMSGEKVWPIQWCGARCGTDSGDIDWTVRYGEAAGWRIATQQSNPEEWIDSTGERVTNCEASLSPGDWYLYPRDLDGHESLQDALRDRMRDGMPEPVYMVEPDTDGTEWAVKLLTSAEEAAAAEAAKRRVREELDAPPALDPWFDQGNEEKRERWLRILRAVRQADASGQRGLAEASGVPLGTLQDDLKASNDRIHACVRGGGGEVYELTESGRRALEIPWGKV